MTGRNWRTEGRKPDIPTATSEQKALDIFAGEWASALPRDFAHFRAGSATLFDDSRMHWGIKQLGGVAKKRVLELGPLEGGHSYMLEKAGARAVLGIEANPRAYLRCLVVKQILELQRVRFICDDFVPYLRTTHDFFDVVIARGVLYHQVHPMQMLADLARVTSSLFIWTHYFDAGLIENSALSLARFGVPEEREFAGLRYQQCEFSYDRPRHANGFIGGPLPGSRWLSKADIIHGLRHFGFADIRVGFEEPRHPNGPSLAIVAKKRSWPWLRRKRGLTRPR